MLRPGLPGYDPVYGCGGRSDVLSSTLSVIAAVSSIHRGQKYPAVRSAEIIAISTGLKVAVWTRSIEEQIYAGVLQNLSSGYMTME